MTTNAFIVEGNALELDWESVVSKYEVSYIMGNPPFVGARLMEQGSVQKKEVQNIFGKIKDVQDLDYVTCWYKLAAEYIQNTKYKYVLFLRTLFVRDHKFQFYGMFYIKIIGFILILHIRRLNGVVNHQRKLQSIVLLLASLNLIEKKKDCFQQK